MTQRPFVAPKTLVRLFRFLLAAGTAALALSGCTALPPATPAPQQYQTAPGADSQAVLMKTQDNLTLFGQWWKPAGEPRGVVLLLHGTMAHSGFYYPWAQQLTARGYAVFGIDLRGWGQSQGFGRRGYVKDVHEYVDDVALAYREVKRAYPTQPLFLQGESLGGGVAVLADLRGDLPVQGLILNAPGVKARLGRFTPGWLSDAGLWTLGNAGRAWPNFPAVPLGNKFLFDHLGKTFIFDPAVHERAWKDPYMTHSTMPVSWLTAVEDMTSQAQKEMSRITTPFIVLQGTKDNLVPLKASQSLMAKTSSADKTSKIYEGVSHCTLHDFGKEQVWADTLSWLDAHTRQTAQVEPATRPQATPVAAAATP